jgi:ABC-type glycerol-3-phosphate transport system substrate-binding protein
LFGTFFELVVALGGRLFDDEQRPTMATPEAEHAVQTLCALAARAPADLVDWHYDDVDAALLAGRLDAAAAWPGGFGAIRASSLAKHLQPHRYPTGPVRRVSYSGCHAWAVPRTCADLDGAVALLTRLIGTDAQAVDAAGGNMCAHGPALSAVEPKNELDRRRLEITREMITDAMIGYPPLVRFPAIEDAGWSAIREALRGRRTAAQAVAAIQASAVAVLDPSSH